VTSASPLMHFAPPLNLIISQQPRVKVNKLFTQSKTDWNVWEKTFSQSFTAFIITVHSITLFHFLTRSLPLMPSSSNPSSRFVMRHSLSLSIYMSNPLHYDYYRIHSSQTLSVICVTRVINQKRDSYIAVK